MRHILRLKYVAVVNPIRDHRLIRSDDLDRFITLFQSERSHHINGDLRFHIDLELSDFLRRDLPGFGGDPRPIITGFPEGKEMIEKDHFIVVPHEDFFETVRSHFPGFTPGSDCGFALFLCHLFFGNRHNAAIHDGHRFVGSIDGKNLDEGRAVPERIRQRIIRSGRL